ncbi:Uncharacterised protein [Mycobacteroides abscessus subsp. massiliense]|nr:Uncharacterised protein [Mycobacteroides abscessus subsp. massiliense]
MHLPYLHITLQALQQYLGYRRELRMQYLHHRNHIYLEQLHRKHRMLYMYPYQRLYILPYLFASFDKNATLVL